MGRPGRESSDRLRWLLHAEQAHSSNPAAAFRPNRPGPDAAQARERPPIAAALGHASCRPRQPGRHSTAPLSVLGVPACTAHTAATALQSTHASLGLPVEQRQPSFMPCIDMRFAAGHAAPTTAARCSKLQLPWPAPHSIAAATASHRPSCAAQRAPQGTGPRHTANPCRHTPSLSSRDLCAPPQWPSRSRRVSLGASPPARSLQQSPPLRRRSRRLLAAATRAMEAEQQDSPWASPPPFLVQGILRCWLAAEPRWALLVAPLRAVSRGWREAVGDALEVLAPRPCAAFCGALAVAQAASKMPGLRLLQLEGHGYSERLQAHSCATRCRPAAAASLLFALAAFASSCHPAPPPLLQTPITQRCWRLCALAAAHACSPCACRVHGAWAASPSPR